MTHHPLAGQLARAVTGSVHHPHFQAAVAIGLKRNMAAVGRKEWVHIDGITAG